MRPLSKEELNQIEQNVLAQLNVTGESTGTEKLADTMAQVSAKVCRLMIQEYQKAASSPEQL